MKLGMTIVAFLGSLCVAISTDTPKRFLNNSESLKQDTGNPKHILFLMIDDLGWNDVSYNTGESDLMSPYIDELAYGGIRFNRYYTHNLCGPSRVSFLTGRYSFTTGMQGTVLINGQPLAPPKEAWTVAEHLQKNGWATAAIGKWDAGMVTWGNTPNCRGFDYFYGFYSPVVDFWTHYALGSYQALDLRENFEVDRTQDGVYATHLYTQKAQAWITDTVGNKGAEKTFMYFAQQAMHAPIQAPDEYSERCRAKGVSRFNNRDVYCGMMLAMDESIKNVTDTYKALGIWDDTVLVLATDNGGHVKGGGNNWPLRGEKATGYEGGMRGVSFMYWAGLDSAIKGTESEAIIHCSDWLPTFVGGVAGLEIEKDGWPQPLDGFNIWEMLTVPGVPSQRKSILHQINGHPVHQESYFDGQYKIVRNHPTNYNWDVDKCERIACSEGWYRVPPQFPVPPPAAERLVNGTNSFVDGGVWLFDVMGDPTEQTDLSTTNPDIVTRLEGEIAAWKAKGIEQTMCHVDPMSDPSKYFDNVWTPWRGSRTPSCDAGGIVAPDGNSCGFVKGHLDKLVLRSNGKTCGVTGWCAAIPNHGLDYKATTLTARVLVDGVEAGTASAFHPHGAVGNHGFGTDFPCDHSGFHTVNVQCKSEESGEWNDLESAPKCIQDGAIAPCDSLTEKNLIYM